MNSGHETQDVDVGSLFLIIIMFFLCGVLILSTVWIFMHSLQVKGVAGETAPSRVMENPNPFPEPRLETQPAVTLEKVRAGEDARLKSYGWVDRKSGIAHIPIDRAMQLLLARGLPEVGAGQTPLQLMQSRPQGDRK